MNRIYLTPRKHQANGYVIRDRLNGKKLGKITKKSGSHSIKIKKKYRKKHLKKEARCLFKQKPNKWITRYHNILKAINRDFFDIDQYQLPAFCEALQLTVCELDLFDRPAYLHPMASHAWKKMRNSANHDGIDLRIISAFRSIDYQKQLIENKLAKGQNIKNIIKVSALPGFSEHHTGCAVDIGSPGESVLEESFEQSAAFAWLMDNANSCGFYLTYPRGNTTGICYEPWHWCYRKT